NNHYWINLTLDSAISWDVELIVDGISITTVSGSGSQNVSIPYTHPISSNSTYIFKVTYTVGSSSVTHMYGPYIAYVDFVAPDVYVIWPINSNSYTHGYRELIFLVVDDLADTITCNYNISGPVSYSNTTQINNLSIYSTLLLFNQGNYLLNITCNDSLNIRNTVITFNIRESGGSRDDESNEVPRGNQSTNNQTTNQTTNNQSQNVTLPNQNQTMNVSPQNNVSTQQNFTNNQNRQDNTNQNVSGNQTTQNIIPNQNNYPRPPPQQQPPQPTPTNNNSDTGTNQNTSPTQQTENSTQNQSSNQQNRAVSDNTGNVLGIIGILLLIVIILVLLRMAKKI
ncbi:MAG: hypothetical protein NZ908_01495, partial [Candidatus Micrarchaeota archaeon]|nr:hypothetical protein [Candidatus Micrarchaeota archaeon]